MKNMKKMNKGFTLIELLIVIAIIAIILAVLYVALDPLTRFRDSRDSARWQDVSALAEAIVVDQVDNGGSYLSVISNATSSEVFMIGSATTGCEANDAYCDTSVATTTNCLDLSGLITEGYIGEVPVSPNGSGSWSSSLTGYTIQRDATGAITVRACESENSSEIYIVR